MPEIRLQTYWSDSDPAGIVYFANYLNLLDKAEEELFPRLLTRMRESERAVVFGYAEAFATAREVVAEKSRQRA